MTTMSQRPRPEPSAALTSGSTTAGSARASGPSTPRGSASSGSEIDSRLRADVVVGDTVRVATDEGSRVRGKRRWRLMDLGIVHSKAKSDHAWLVLVNGHSVILFADEFELAREKT